MVLIKEELSSDDSVDLIESILIRSTDQLIHQTTLKQLEQTILETTVSLNQFLKSWIKSGGGGGDGVNIERLLHSKIKSILSNHHQIPLEPDDLSFSSTPNSSSSVSNDELSNSRSLALERVFLNLKLVKQIYEIYYFFYNQLLLLNETKFDEEGRILDEEINNSWIRLFELRCELIYKSSCWYSTKGSKDPWNLHQNQRLFLKNLLDQLWGPSNLSKPRSNGTDPSVKLSPSNRPIELSKYILSNQIKALFNNESNLFKDLNLRTGRLNIPQTNSSLLFGSSVDEFDNSSIWKTRGTGFWNCISFLLQQSKDQCKGDVEELWPLVLPPTISLLEDSKMIYRIRGTRLTIDILETFDPSIIFKTGIHDLFQKSFSSSFSLLNIDQTVDLLKITFEANLRLIESTTVKFEQENDQKSFTTRKICQSDENLETFHYELDSETYHDEEDYERRRKFNRERLKKINRLNRLIEESVFNVISFGKTNSKSLLGKQEHEIDENDHCYFEIDDYAIDCLGELIKREYLGIFIARYLRITFPYLIEVILQFDEINNKFSFLNFVKVEEATTKKRWVEFSSVIVKINEFIKNLFDLKNYHEVKRVEESLVKLEDNQLSKANSKNENDKKDLSVGCDDDQQNLKSSSGNYDNDDDDDDYDGFFQLVVAWRNRLLVVLLIFLIQFRSSHYKNKTQDDQSEFNPCSNSDELETFKIQYLIKQSTVKTIKSLLLSKDSLKSTELINFNKIQTLSKDQEINHDCYQNNLQTDDSNIIKVNNESNDQVDREVYHDESSRRRRSLIQLLKLLSDHQFQFENNEYQTTVVESVKGLFE